METEPAYITHTPTATIAQNRPRSGGDPAFTQVLDIIAQAAIGAD